MTDELLENGLEETPEPAAQGDPRKPLPLRTKVLFGVLAAVCAGFAVNSGHIYMLEGELKAIAAEKELDQREHFEQFSRGVETASTVTASKANLFFGDASGKIEVFVRNASAPDTVQGFDYFLSRDDAGVWIVTETGHSFDEDSQRRGTEAFARLP